MLVREEKGSFCAKIETRAATTKAKIAKYPKSAIATPPPIAIPSPPLNLVKTEFQCPSTAKAAGMRITDPSIPIIPETITAKAPFAKSKTSTITAEPLPTVFRTLEAPASPVPVLKISIPLRRLSR